MEDKKFINAYFGRENYREIEVQYDPEQHALWCYLSPTARPCCSVELLGEVRQLLIAVAEYINRQPVTGGQDALHYFVIASRIPGVFNLGGDLSLFIRHIRAGDREALYRYARTSADIAYASYSLPVTTITLVQGDAYGGGFEGALVSRVLIAERQARMGLPDVLFNLVPICAYNLLARRLDPSRAERIVLSGRSYSAESLYEMGVVDLLADSGSGENTVRSYIRKQNRASNSYQAIQKIRQTSYPLRYEDLLLAANTWADAALQLKERDLRIMERIAQSQQKLIPMRQFVDIKQLA